jgi:hypothetical protein
MPKNKILFNPESKLHMQECKRIEKILKKKEEYIKKKDGKKIKNWD